MLAPLAMSIVVAFPQESRVVARVPEGAEVVEGTLRIAPGGTKAAYVARVDGELHPVIGEKLGRSYYAVDPPVLDAAGEHVAFRAVRSSDRVDPECVVLIDGREYARETWIGGVSLSPDGSPAYWAALGVSTGAGGHYEFGPLVLCLGKKRGDKMQAGGLRTAFSADGERVFSTGSKTGEWSVLWLDRRGRQGELALGHALEARPRPDGREIACTIRESTHFYVERWTLPDKDEPMVVARLGKRFAGAGAPVYSSDGGRIAFKVLREDKLGVALSEDETADCAYDYVDDLALDPAGSTVAFVASTGCEVEEDVDEDATIDWRVLDDLVKVAGGRWFLVVGADRGSEHDRARSPTWSPDGSRIAYAARDGDEWRLVVHDGPSSPPCDDLAQLVWAPDSRSVWYGSRRGRDLCWSSLAVD